jgi:OOP family OmpA-OmpF porin
MKLSQRRADAVMKYLVDKGGVPAAQLEAQGFGKTRPIVEGNTEEARAKNRRVEFVIVDDKADDKADQ